MKPSWCAGTMMTQLRNWHQGPAGNRPGVRGLVVLLPAGSWQQGPGRHPAAGDVCMYLVQYLVLSKPATEEQGQTGGGMAARVGGQEDG